jgi:1-acyl-sn-glycerol-3-phosphate acyltransferase
LQFKYGAVSFASKTNSYIVPFAITGKYKLFRKSIKITYGKPYKLKSDDLTKENDILRNKVLELKGRDNHGNDK